MIVQEDAHRQEALEARLLQIWLQDVPEDKTMEEVFGPYESWLVTLGPHQLLLHPVLKEWLVLDRLHDTWESTGFGPEEVVFVVQGDVLGAREKGAGAAVAPVDTGQAGAMPAGEPPPVPPPAAEQETQVCPSCQAPSYPGDRFCHQCGASLSVSKPPVETLPKVIVCPSCQHPNAVGRNFCTRCGTRLG